MFQATKRRLAALAAGLILAIGAGAEAHAQVVIAPDAIAPPSRAARAFLIKYYGADQDPRLEEPLHTITTKHRFGLVTIHGQDYEIVDIGLRMLEPHELFPAQGFLRHYVISEIPDPKLLFTNGRQAEGDPRKLPRVKLTKSAQVRMCGNSVCPPLAEALIRSNFEHEREIARAA